MNELAWTVARMSQLAVLLEASSPKPGNVNRAKGFSDTAFRNFIASAVLMVRGVYHAATKGTLLAKREIGPSEVRVGMLIFETVKEVFTGLNKSNTIFGTILLHVPLATAISADLSSNNRVDPKTIQQWLKVVIDATSVDDTIQVYRALRIVNPPGDMHKKSAEWTNLHKRYDIQNPKIFDNIREDKMTLGRLFKKSAKVDEICKEWSNYYQNILFEVLPYLRPIMTGLDNAEEAIVRAFIWLLSQRPDGHIVKRAGSEIANRICEMAKTINDSIEEGLKIDQMLDDFDALLRSDGNLLNPGTTADVISTATFCRLMEIILEESNQ